MAAGPSSWKKEEVVLFSTEGVRTGLAAAVDGVEEANFTAGSAIERVCEAGVSVSF